MSGKMRQRQRTNKQRLKRFKLRQARACLELALEHDTQVWQVVAHVQFRGGKALRSNPAALPAASRYAAFRAWMHACMYTTTPSKLKWIQSLAKVLQLCREVGNAVWLARIDDDGNGGGFGFPLHSHGVGCLHLCTIATYVSFHMPAQGQNATMRL